MIGRGSDTCPDPVERLRLKPSVGAIELPVRSRHGPVAQVLVRAATHVDRLDARTIPDQRNREQREQVTKVEGDECFDVVTGRLINRRAVDREARCRPTAFRKPRHHGRERQIEAPLTEGTSIRGGAFGAIVLIRHPPDPFIAVPLPQRARIQN